MHSDESVSPYSSDPAVSVIETTDVAFHYTTDHNSSVWLQTLRFRQNKWGKTDHELSITESECVYDAQT
jgi:SRSO17 transposase